MTAVVIDTNVGVVANGRHPEAGIECIASCITALGDARRRVVLVDDGLRIFSEYRRHFAGSGQPGAGDAFFKWLWDNQGNRKYCRQITITAVAGADDDFEEFPDDPALTGFDRNDRKFVAVALASGVSPVILNASDTDWWIFRVPLADHGVHVTFLCPELME